jgi:hypothetical protein
MSDPLTPNCREAPRGPRVLRIGVSSGKANFLVREQLEILHGEIFDRNVEHKVKDKCDTLIDILKEIKIKREDMDAIIDVKKLLVR